MKDKLDVQNWHLDAPPPTCDVWGVTVGHLIGYGESHYGHGWAPDYYCPHIITAGRGLVRTPHGEWLVQAGDMFCMWAGVSIDYFEQTSNPWQFYWVQLMGEGSETLARAFGFTTTMAVRRPAQPEAVVRAYRELHAYYSGGEPRDVYRAQSLLYALAEATRRTDDSPGTTSAPVRELVIEAEMVVKSLLQTGLNVTELARALRVSRNTLFRAFREERGITPSDYLQQVRLQRAKALLAQRELTVATVARAAGFADEKYFMRCFRAAEGMTPGQWRAQQDSQQ